MTNDDGRSVARSSTPRVSIISRGGGVTGGMIRDTLGDGPGSRYTATRPRTQTNIRTDRQTNRQTSPLHKAPAAGEKMPVYLSVCW